MPLTEEQIRLVKATAPVFQEHGKTITTHFYHRIFKNHPELKNLFSMANQESGAQPTALANAVFAYAANIDNLGVLGGAVTRIAHKHASLHITADQYPIVGENLLASVKEVLGDAVDQATIDAWKAAYQQLADILIGVEGDLYKGSAGVEGGWEGWRKFKVVKKETESDEIVSFYLEPADHGKLPNYKSGQFVTVKHFVPSLKLVQPRQFTLSSAHNDKYFRISVKKESYSDGADEHVSTLLFDLEEGTELEVSPPYGLFYLNLDVNTPVALISAGVGITPMISMLETLTLQGKDRKVVFVHAARNKHVHAMRAYVKDVVSRHSDFVSSSVWYEDTSDAVKGEDYDHEGRVEISKIKDLVVLPESDYYLCGPTPFMDSVQKQLVEQGVSKDKIHIETLG